MSAIRKQVSSEIKPISVYLTKPSVKLLDVDLYSNLKGRSRQGKYHADHMPLAVAVIEFLKRQYPDASEHELEQMAKDVAAIIIPAEIHQKVSETYGGRNRPQDIEHDSDDLRGAVDRNFDAIKPALKGYGATEEQLESAREKMHKLNEEQGFY